MTENSSNSVSQEIKDPVFLYFNGTGTLGLYTAKYGFMALLALIGIIFDSALVYVTIKSKILHDRCNVLLALESLFAIPLLIGQSFKYLLLQTGINFIPLRLCYYFACIPTICASCSFVFKTLIGIDRLFSVLFPVWYMKKNCYKTYPVLIALGVVHVVWMNYLFYYGVSLHLDTPVICSVSALIQPEVDMQIRIYSGVPSLVPVFCYGLIWALISCKKTGIEAKKRRLITSLTVLIGIDVFGYVQTYSWRLILSFGLLKLSAIDVENYVVYPILCLRTIADGSNAPVLYLISVEYRASFKKQLGWLFGLESTTWATRSAMAVVGSMGGNVQSSQQLTPVEGVNRVSMLQIAEARISAVRIGEERGRMNS